MNGNKSNVLSILSLVFGIIGLISSIILIGGLFSIAGLILGIIALVDNRSQKWLAIGGLVCSGLGILLTFVILVSIIGGSTNSSENVLKETENEIQTDETNFTESDEIESENIDESVLEIESEINAEMEPPIEIFVTDFLNSWSDYVGKKVIVSYACGGFDEYEKCIRSAYDSDSGLQIRSYVDNFKQLEYGDFITITGTVDGKYASYIEIKDAHINYYGNESQNDYEERKAVWDEKQLAMAIEQRESFIESAENVTYDGLRRYPDTYDGKAIQLTLEIKSVEPDGWIFQGDIIATIQGTSNEIAVYDARTVREPRFMNGDTITVYATGNGLAKMQVKDGTGLLSNVIDEYEIPSIRVIYTDQDNVESLNGISNTDDSDAIRAREAGKRAAETLNELFED